MGNLSPVNIRRCAHRARLDRSCAAAADPPDGDPVSAASRLFARKIKNRERAEEAFGLPVTAEIPTAAARDADGAPEVEVASRPDSESSQAYRELAAQIEHVLAHEAGAHAHARRRAGFTLLVTSARDEPARSFVAVNLAAVFAESGHRVMVVTTRGLPVAPQAKDAASAPDATRPDPSDVHDVVAHALPSRIPSVSSLALGSMFSTSQDVLRHFDAFVDAATDVVDLVIFEAPLLSHPLGRPLLSAVDSSIVVCESGRTPTEDGFESQRALTEDVFLPVLGVVLAHAPD